MTATYGADDEEVTRAKGESPVECLLLLCAINRFACLVAFLLLLTPIGCSSPASEARRLPDPVIPPGLPVVELPEIDLGKTMPRALHVPAPASLGQVLPARQFAVKFAARRPSEETQAPARGMQFSIYQRSADGSLVQAATCRLKLSDSETGTDGTVTYEGACIPPRRKGDAIIEISFLDKSYLVRSTRVQ
jgi:hypothetical protein